mmetsp:Transcript_13698/g.24421  ORF Transcript_13698/g.24421 Transcript_13698/m.24421 type:complete len:384 (-) Transcript_13698:2-1153(-)
MTADVGEQKPKSLLYLGLCCIASGATVLGFGASAVLENSSMLQVFKESWGAGGSSFAEISVAMIMAAAGCGGIVLFSGVGYIILYFRESNCVCKLLLLFLFAASAVQIAGGVMFGTTLSSSLTSLTKQANSTDIPVRDRVYLEMGNAVYNKCCYPEWINSTDSEITDPPNYDGDLRLLFQYEIQDCANGYPADTLGIQKVQLESIKALLRSCYDPDVYIPMYNHLDDSICDALEAVDVPMGTSLKIPTTSYSVLDALRIAGIIPNDYVIDDWAMVGFPAETDPEGNPGFNCGLMHAKAIAWIQHLWLSENLGGFVYTCIACGAVQLIGILALIVYKYIGNGGLSDEWIDYEAKAGAGSTVVAPTHRMAYSRSTEDSSSDRVEF